MVIKREHTVLGRLYELREEVARFLDSQQKADLHDKFQSEAKFIRYFPDIDDKHEAWKFIRNPFHCELADVADEVQEEFLELKFNSTAKEDFKDLDLETFWVKYLPPVYPLILHQALQILTSKRCSSTPSQTAFREVHTSIHPLFSYPTFLPGVTSSPDSHPLSNQPALCTHIKGSECVNKMCTMWRRSLVLLLLVTSTMTVAQQDQYLGQSGVGGFFGGEDATKPSTGVLISNPNNNPPPPVYQFRPRPSRPQNYNNHFNRPYYGSHYNQYSSNSYYNPYYYNNYYYRPYNYYG
ncbi:hypothetical protein Pcinc_022285 [Petrolisthes cinctipes]|uniref:Uncharacterized protein n=1 Tax=Petrolisthes cinctipes TaxID=88211 RepID=A0AAE1FI22_PETCI|nr:hypothetical protein Pcinc_022285 [Petrolisthes cinctipes]